MLAVSSGSAALTRCSSLISSSDCATAQSVSKADRLSDLKFGLRIQHSRAMEGATTLPCAHVVDRWSTAKSADASVRCSCEMCHDYLIRMYNTSQA